MRGSSAIVERILETSLKLFNAQGLKNVPVIRIAMELKISSGHVSYHFKTKNDIILALFSRLEDAIRKDFIEAKQPEQPFRPLDAALHQIEVFRTLWHYRFFFNALTHLLSDDPKLQARFMHMQERILDTLRRLFDELIEQQYMRPVLPPNSTTMVAKSCWMMWLSWLSFEQIAHSDRETVRDTAVFDGVMQTFSIIQPYFSREFEDEMLRELRKALPDGAATPRSMARRIIVRKSPAGAA